MKTVTGSCLCQAVKFECDAQFGAFYLCHCAQCQKISGSAHVANLFTDVQNIRWLTGEENVQRYDVPGRSISNAFCGECGTAVPYVSKSGQSLVVPAGSLDEEVSVTPNSHIFWEERAEWYEDVVATGRCERFPE